MKKFSLYLKEAANSSLAPGKLEMAKISAETAKNFAIAEYKKVGLSLEKEIPDFETNFNYAKSLFVKNGKTVRKNMPVINRDQVAAFQKSLKTGSIDISKPFSKSTIAVKNPFPNGLNADTGKTWLKNGLKQFDGDAKDDKISVSQAATKAASIIPIQRQVYFDVVLKQIVKKTIKKVRSQLTDKANILITSADNRLIDGHHRFLTALLIDKNIKLNTVKIGLKLDQLLPLSLSYSDAIGNKRNK